MSKRFRLFCSLVVPAMLLSALAAPALANGAGSGDKKPVGTIVSFDGTTLTMEARDGSTLSAPVSDTVQIKVAHRGRKGQEKTKKPSNGTEANLVPGASVLRLKMKCGEVVKLRVKPAPPADPTTSTTHDETDPSSTGSPVGDATDPDCGEGSSEEEADGQEAGEEEADETSSESDTSEEEEEEVEDEEEEDPEDEAEAEEDPTLVEEVLEELPL